MKVTILQKSRVENREEVMSKFQHDVMLRVVKILDVLMIELPFAAYWFLYRCTRSLHGRAIWPSLRCFFVLYITLGKVYDAFWMSMQRISELVYGQLLEIGRASCRERV